MANPKMKTKRFQPGLEIEHEVALTGVGVTVVHTTVCVSSRTAAQLMESPPNTSLIQCVGPVVHSLGAPPSFASMHQLTRAGATGYSGAVVFQYCTVDNSAVYFFPSHWTGSAMPVSVRVVAVR